jgi:PKD repeat protein
MLDGEVSGSGVGPFTVGGETDIMLSSNPAPYPLMANFTVSPIGYVTKVEQPVHFTDTSSSNNSEITNRTWFFHSGGKAYGKNVTYHYTEPGSYPVILKITDSNNYTAHKTITITVEETRETGNNIPGFHILTTIIAITVTLLLQHNRKRF